MKQYASYAAGQAWKLKKRIARYATNGIEMAKNFRCYMGTGFIVHSTNLCRPMSALNKLVDLKTTRPTDLPISAQFVPNSNSTKSMVSMMR